jgi:hypothetical protein
MGLRVTAWMGMGEDVRGEKKKSGHQKIGPATNERRLFENESCWVPESEVKTCE